MGQRLYPTPKDNTKLVEQRRILLGTAGEKPAIPASLDVEDERYVLCPETWVEEPQQVKVNRDGGTVVSMDLGNRLGVVADFEPRVLWGVEGDRPFTVLDARMTIEFGSGFASLPQIYEARHILWDAHIRGFDSPAEAVRISWPIRWAGWKNEETVLMDGGRLSAWSDGNRPGLVWEPDKTSSIHTLTQQFPTILNTLFQLWTEKKTSAGTVEVRIENVGWCTVKSTHVPSATYTQPLLDLDRLTLSVVKNWLSMADMLGPLPFIAVHDGSPLQVDAQMLATALEGLHRRLHPGATRFHEPVPNSLLDRARRAATSAAVNVLSGTLNEAAAKQAYDEALGHMGQPSYAARIAELLPRVESAAPGLLGPSQAAWIKDMKDLRNIQSHGLQNHDDFGEAEISRYYVLASSGRWVLKILLLLELIDEEQVRSALRVSERFMYALANIDREMYWKEFSAYRYFSEASRSENIQKYLRA